MEIQFRLHEKMRQGARTRHNDSNVLLFISKLFPRGNPQGNKNPWALSLSECPLAVIPLSNLPNNFVRARRLLAHAGRPTRDKAESRAARRVGLRSL